MTIRNLRFDAVTNRETWLERVQVTDESGVPFDVTESAPRLEVQYQPTGAKAFSAADGDGQLSTRDDGIIEWMIDVSVMQNLRPGLYNVGLVATIEGMARQLLTGTIEIESGNIS